ncbi:hypothetical protein SPBR_08191 [Sporothrix brasiliensis 5110]|uniref:Pre-mRNA splicing factor CLF1 n=1 Tax=Sporothrix brasiliensis 5110 TaxID=1398154 RepID=A0A0C2ELI0_9PEZI|nr:uncharacterized protein SPBR_08191 [Sporothrix brasiliensis 5110]KIH86974.1 hypothetical protein SPBR_08191 [Sporothrix brasiliensis 5110]
MPLPQPAVALNNICSTIFNNTLYTYSSSAFQSLDLTSGAKWKKLDYSNTSVSGAVCVGSTPGDPTLAAFFVVGGKTDAADYPGLQKYTYATGVWETITLASLVTQNRLNHGAAYINATDSILVYSGQQDDSTGASQQTYTIGASAPYIVKSVSSPAAPLTLNPILLEWSDSQIAMIGGSSTNTAVMLFDSASENWINSGANLLDPLTTNTTGLQAALIMGDDNSKNLYTFDVTVSPNQVKHIVLQDGTGAPVVNAGPSKRSAQEDATWNAELSRRASLTASNWPAYNASLAPTTTRSGFSIAEGLDGMVVLSGGGGSDVLCVFNGRSNSWRNATQMLSAKKSLVQTSSASSSSSTTAPTTLVIAPSSASVSATSTLAATSSAAAAPAPVSHNLPTNAVLGIVLGGVAAMGIVLIGLYFLIMRRRKRRNFLEAAHSRRASGTSSSEKDAFAIASDSFPQRPNVGSKGTFRAGHQAQDSQGSFSSVAILMGRVNQPRQPDTIQRNNSGGASRRGSTSDPFNKGFKSTISRPIPQTQPGPSMSANSVSREMQFERGAGAGAGAGIGAGAASAATGSYGRSVTDPKQQHQQQHQSQQSNNQSGTRRSSGWNRYWSGGSALNMLGFGSGNGHNSRSSKRTTVASDASSNYSTNNQNRITQDSATVPPLDIPGMPEAKPRFQRVNSGSPTISNYDSYLKDGMQGKIMRSTSQTSSKSGYSSGIPASVHDMWDPTSSSDHQPWGSNRAPSSAYGSSTQITSLGPASGSGGKKSYVPTGMSRQPQLAMADTSSDMSWLNLGDVNARV